MNARFRIGKEYKIEMNGDFFISRRPLVYVGYSGEDFIFNIKNVGGGEYYQRLPKEVLEAGEVSVKTEWDK